MRFALLVGTENAYLLLSLSPFSDIVRQLGGGVGVVSAFSIRILDCEKPVPKRNRLSVSEIHNSVRKDIFV